MESSSQSRNDRFIAGGRKRGRDFCEMVLKGAKARRRRLYFESLESRRLLAGEVAARFQFDDLNGQPLTSLQAGGDYLLRMFVRDARSTPGGIKQAYFDVSYPASLITVNGAINHGSSFTSAPFGDSATAGLLDEVGGRDPDIPPTPASAEQLLFSVPIHANSAGTLNVTATTATRLSFFFDTVVGLQASNIAYSGGTIEIVSAGISISPTSILQTTESGGTASFTAVLQSQPTANVSFSIASSNTNEGIVSTNNLTFTPANWNTPQTVIVSGVDDAVVDGNINFSVITGAVVSNDSRYNGFDPSNVSVTNTDNDVATLSIVAPAINESNSDSTINFAVTLNKAVNGGFTVAFNSANGTATSSNDFILSTVSPLAFTGIAGETKNISVLIKGEQIVESNETFTLTLGTVTPVDPVVAASIVTGASAIGIIVNDDIATLNISSPTITESNSSQSVEFVVRLDKPVAGGLSVAFSSANGTADANEYSVNTSSPLTFLGTAGETKTIAVTINGDTVVEPNETFSISLGVVTPVAPVQASSILTNASATGTILNDDTAITIAATDAAKPEGNSGMTPFTFLVTRSGLTTGTTSVNYTVAGAGFNPADATDFGGSLPSGVINFAANETSKTITINVQGDTSIESDKGFNVTLSNLSGAGLITTATAAGTIQNDDTSLAISGLSASKPEGDSGLTAFTFTIIRAGVLSGTNSVNYLVTGNGPNPADGADFGGAFPTGVVTFNPGDTNQTVTIRVNGDTAVEPDEGFLISLSNATGGAQITAASASGQIQNDDSVISLTASDAVKLEGNAGSTAFLFSVIRSGLTSSGATFNFSTAGNGTNPANAADFGGTFPAGQIIFAPNESTKTITLNVSGDLAIESDEGFIVTLSNLSGGVLATAAGIIRTDDANISISATDGTKLEGDTGLTPFRFTLNRTGVTSAAASVNYAVSGSGLNPADATDFGGQLPSGTINFAANETSKVITINVSTDTTIEADEEFTVTLSGATNGTQIAPASAVSTIQSDEVALAIAALDSTKAEGNSATTPFTFTVTRAGGTLGTVTVNYAVNGTGANPANAADFGGTLPSGVITFNPNEKSKTLTIPVSGDATLESTETFLVTLSNASGQTQISTATAIGTILNDDATTLSIKSVTKSEGNSGTTQFVFEVTLSAAVATGFDVAYSLTSGTANIASDLGTFSIQPLHFDGTANEKHSISIPVMADTLVELNETFQITLGAISNLGSGVVPSQITVSGNPATGTIQNDDAATFTINDVTRLEGDLGQAQLVFNVSLSQAVDVPVSVSYATVDQSAQTSDNDYLATSGTLTFLPGGPLSQSISISVNGDTTVEVDETFKVVLSSIDSGTPARNVTIARSEGIGTIQADDGSLLSISDAQISEGNSGTLQLTFNVTVSKADVSPFTVDFATANGTATTADGDFVSRQGTLTFTPSGPTTQSVAITINGDNKVEGDESFQLLLSNLVAISSQVLLNRSVASGKLVNDDAAVLSVDNVQTVEGDSGLKSFVFNVNLSNPVDVPVTLSYTTADDTARSTGDYVPTSGTLTFNPGDALRKTVTVSVNGDALVESDEKFNLLLSNVMTATQRDVTFGKATGVATITNDDFALVTISASRQAIEESTNGEFTIVTNSRFQTDTTLTLEINGTASGGSDYSPIGTSIVFPANTDSITLPVSTIADKLVEGNETVTIKLIGINSTQGKIGAQNSATVTVSDNDSASVSIESTKSVSEVGSPLNVVVTLTTSDGLGGTATLAPGVSLSAVVVDAGGGTATNGADYSAIGSRSVTFAAGASNGATSNVSFIPVHDTLVEGNETVRLRLQDLSTTLNGQFTVSNANCVVSILDNDSASLAIQSTVAASEAGGAPSIVVTLSLSDGAGGTATLAPGVSFTADVVDVGGGTATSGTDYAVFGTKPVSFPVGSTNGSTATITFTPTNDTLVEGSETVRLQLQNARSASAAIATISTPDSLVTIQDNDTATLSIASSRSITEAGNSQVILVTLTTSDGAGGVATLAPEVTILAEVVDAGTGTASGASNPTDYATFGKQSVSFPAGATHGATASVTVTAINDALIEGDEKLQLKLQNLVVPTAVTSQIQLGNTTSTVTISDNDTATLAFATTSIAEGVSASVVVITLSTSDGASGTATLAPGATLSVEIVDAGGGTAISGTDFAAIATKTATFAAGSANGATSNISISPVNDALVEGNETIILRMQNLVAPAGAQVSTASSGIITIADNDTAKLSIEAGKSFTEQGATQLLVVTLTTSDGAGGFATLAPGVNLQASVVDAATGTAVSGTDYSPFGTKSVSFAAGSANGATASLSLEAINDALVEGDETVQLRLQNLSSMLGGQAALDNINSRLTIVDNDTARLGIATTSLLEAGGAQSVTVRLVTSNGAGGTAVLAPGVSLSAAIVDAGGGTASSGVDYVALGSKTVTFAAGAADGATENATLNLTNDSLVEGAETLNLRLQNLVSSAGGQATLDSTSTALTIQDNDTASVSIESNKTIFEQNGSQTILVRLTTADGAGGTATLAPGFNLAVQIVDAGGGTAQSGVDYQSFSTQLVTFAAGEANNATKSISVTPIVRPGIDPTRSVNLRLEKVATSGNGEFSLGNSQSLVTISDAPPTSELRGFVYIDGNGNGLREPNREPGIPGVTLTLSGTDIVGGTVQLFVMSGDDGSYGFNGLRAGTYKITQTQPAAFLDGKNSTGIPGATSANDSLANLRLETHAIVNNNNFGELGLKARFVNTRMFVGSMLGRSSQLRAVVAQAEDVVGHASQAAQIRLKNVPSVATANTITNNTVAGPVQSLQAEGESADIVRNVATKMVASTAPTATALTGKPNTTTEPRNFVAPVESIRQACVSSTDQIFSSPDLQAMLQSVYWSKQYATSDLPNTDSLSATLGPRSRIWQLLRFINRPS